ncbi:hypothetical protein GWM83_04065, partial [Candidatus Bathyarchaeota archaeon]|nr:hypothetical protein [Candidatus Bathyarchaeota archaeon]NIR15064.1 hypothetical protein [Desulfobacterales bacterium]NIW34717.1 hypothetical protein [Candidatus Bathyarchaeota archaeon]
MKENSAMERAAGLREELGQRKEVSIELDVESGRKILKGDFSALPLEAKVRAAVAKNNLNEGVKAAERCDFREAILSAVVAQRSMCDVQTILVTEFNLAGLDRGEF